MNTYTFTAEFVQALVNNLNQQPAVHSRALLNHIETECSAQDKAKEEEAKAAFRAEVVKELANEPSLDN